MVKMKIHFLQEVGAVLHQQDETTKIFGKEVKTGFSFRWADNEPWKTHYFYNGAPDMQFFEKLQENPKTKIVSAKVVMPNAQFTAHLLGGWGRDGTVIYDLLRRGLAVKGYYISVDVPAGRGAPEVSMDYPKGMSEAYFVLAAEAAGLVRAFGKNKQSFLSRMNRGKFEGGRKTVLSHQESQEVVDFLEIVKTA